MKNNKFLYGWKIMVNYGQGYEYEIFEESLSEAKKRLKEYRENCSYPVKVSWSRELNPDFISKV